MGVLFTPAEIAAQWRVRVRQFPWPTESLRHENFAEVGTEYERSRALRMRPPYSECGPGASRLTHTSLQIRIRYKPLRDNYFRIS